MNRLLARFVELITPPERPAQKQNKMIVISVLFGLFGVDRYMMGYKYWWAKPLTLGGFWLWYWYDVIMITLGKLKMANKQSLVLED